MKIKVVGVVAVLLALVGAAVYFSDNGSFKGSINAINLSVSNRVVYGISVTNPTGDLRTFSISLRNTFNGQQEPISMPAGYALHFYDGINSLASTQPTPGMQRIIPVNGSVGVFALQFNNALLANHQYDVYLYNGANRLAFSMYTTPAAQPRPAQNQPLPAPAPVAAGCSQVGQLIPASSPVRGQLPAGATVSVNVYSQCSGVVGGRGSFTLQQGVATGSTLQRMDLIPAERIFIYDGVRLLASTHPDSPTVSAIRAGNNVGFFTVTLNEPLRPNGLYDIYAYIGENRVSATTYRAPAN